MSRTRRAATLVLAIGFAVLGCSSWVSVAPSAVSISRPEDARVYLTDGTQVMVYHARVAGDSLIGQLAATTHFATALTSVRRVETYRFDRAKTLRGVESALIIALMLGAAVLLAWPYAGGPYT